MKKYVCDLCGYIYDEAAGDPENGVAPGSFPIIFLLLNLFGLSIITLALIQNELNKYTPNF